MRTPLCDSLGIEFPIFAFTHCRDVVAAVSRAGGFGVLGAVGFSPAQLEIELAWIDAHVGDSPYGVDVVIPGKYEGMGEADPAKLAEQLRAMVPERHLEFARKLLADHGVPELPDGETRTGQLLGWTAATATPQVETALKSWTAARLERAMMQFADASFDARRMADLADTIAQRALLSLAVAARRSSGIS